MAVEEAPVVWLCRYRYATGCTAEYYSKAALVGHEKMTAIHAQHRITLRDCPVCGTRCGDERKRAMHLSAEHGITADSEQRSEVDARQVKELYDKRQPAGPVPDATANVLKDPDANLVTGTTPAELNGSNGHHSPAPLGNLPLLRDMVDALIAEVEEQRAWRAGLADVEADAARYRQILGITTQD